MIQYAMPEPSGDQDHAPDERTPDPELFLFRDALLNRLTGIIATRSILITEQPNVPFATLDGFQYLAHEEIFSSPLIVADRTVYESISVSTDDKPIRRFFYSFIDPHLRPEDPRQAGFGVIVYSNGHYQVRASLYINEPPAPFVSADSPNLDHFIERLNNFVVQEALSRTGLAEAGLQKLDRSLLVPPPEN